MKTTLSFLLILGILASPVFAAESGTAGIKGFDSSLSESETVINKVLGLIKIIAIAFLIGSIFLGAIRYLRADGAQKSEVIKTTVICTVVAASLILVAYKVPIWFGMDAYVNA